MAKVVVAVVCRHGRSLHFHDLVNDPAQHRWQDKEIVHGRLCIYRESETCVTGAETKGILCGKHVWIPDLFSVRCTEVSQGLGE